MLSFLVSDVPWRYDLRQEPDAVIPHVRSCAGGRLQGWSLPRHVQRVRSERRISTPRKTFMNAKSSRI